MLDEPHREKRRARHYRCGDHSRQRCGRIAGTAKRPGGVSTGRMKFDSTNDHFPDYVLTELLPVVAKMKTADGRAINISPDGNDHAATGASTGGIGSFTLAWQRPRPVHSHLLNHRHLCFDARRARVSRARSTKTDPKPIRIFLEDGSADAWNPLFGSWYDANLNMESAPDFRRLRCRSCLGGTHGHNAEAWVGHFSPM